MSERTALPELARRLLTGPAQQLLDHGVRQSTTAAALCRQLNGRVLQIDPGTAALASHFIVTDERLRIQPGYHDSPDATIAGAPLQLARLSGPDPQRVIRDGDVTVSGDAEVAEHFQYLLELVRPDPEEELSRLTGDAVAHEAGRAVRGLTAWAEGARRSLGRSVSEYLSEESQLLVTRVEADEFCAAVDTLAADVDRLDARLRILRDANLEAQNKN